MRAGYFQTNLLRIHCFFAFEGRVGKQHPFQVFVRKVDFETGGQFVCYNEVFGPFEHYADFFQVVKREFTVAQHLDDVLCRLHPHPANAQNHFVAGIVNIHREKIQVEQGITQFRVHIQIEKRLVFVKDFPGLKLLKPHEPVGFGCGTHNQLSTLTCRCK